MHYPRPENFQLQLIGSLMDRLHLTVALPGLKSQARYPQEAGTDVPKRVSRASSQGQTKSHEHGGVIAQPPELIHEGFMALRRPCSSKVPCFALPLISKQRGAEPDKLSIKGLRGKVVLGSHPNKAIGGSAERRRDLNLTSVYCFDI